MAADNEIDIESLKEQLKELGMVYEEELKARMGNVKALKDYADKVKRARDGFKKSADEILDSMKNLRKGLNAGEMTASELAKELDTLRDQINKTSDQDKKAALIAQKADLERLNAQNKANEVMKDSALKFAGGMVTGVSKAFANASRAALAGGDSFEMAGAMMNAGVDLVNTANQGGANALKSFGAATAGAGGKVGRFGIAASIAGEALSAVSNGLSELAKAGIGFMISQTKSLINSFNSMAGSGAVFAGGMMGMIRTAQTAGMTLEQFSKAVTSNTDALTKTGLGLTEASKRMAGAMQAGGRAARDGMFALGMSMEEQAGAYADTMALLAGPSGQLKSSNQAVAQETQEYAKNLKLISSITGQDAKAKMDKLRQDNDTLAFNSYLNGLSEKERLRTQEAMAMMSQEDQRAFREKVLYGDVISKDLAASRAVNTAIAKNQDEQYAASQRHALTAKFVADGYQRNAQDMLAQSNELGKSIGLAREGVGAEVSQTTNAVTQYAQRFRNAEEAARVMEEQQRKAAAGQGGAEITLQAQQQEAALKMQALAVENLGLFSTALQQAYEAAMASVEALAKFAKGIPGESMWTKMAMAALPGILAGVLPAILSKVFGGAGGARGSTPLNPMFVEDVTGSGGGGGGGRGRKGKAKPGTKAKLPKGRLPGLGIVSAISGAAFLASDLSDISAQEKAGTLTQQEAKEAKGGAVGSATIGAAGAWGGAEAGAALGTIIFPGVGTVIGGLLGGALGYWAGSNVGEELGKNIAKDPKAKDAMYKKNLDDLRKRANPQIPTPTVGATGALVPTTTVDPTTLAQHPAAVTAQYAAKREEEVKKAMAAPSASASPEVRQQITLLQQILGSMEQNNRLTSGLLQNSY